ncbi:hypothetical protein ABID82_003360 [Methylobacterium sp. PvP062]|uniref:Uncharacterized protein n=2 Tax=Methylobacterium TaxID=407 RepID=A0ABV2NCD9_9HYPH|nr:hypothetical protein EBB05_13725 [Methylobacterium brachiatum]MBP2492604.1 hypothetical protein [Methylobacterium sp. PvP105]MBP2501024.1 hypothetical protein [Methylobacterium sp. PvP109]MDQ0440554.1 hypothetical protein [Methylobacterium persicinum]
MNIVRTFLLAVLALALAIAPAAPCTMGRPAAAADRALADVAGAMPHARHAQSPRSHDGPDVPGHAGLHAGSQDAPAATAGDDGCPGHRHRSKRPACPSPCCTLGCQAALPAAAWLGMPLDYAPFERVLIVQEDGNVDARPLRIERPPRLGA